ncbi:MAG: thioredoxin [Solobacterium sp.]|nr:thioredoxin [Solobacterium sp.]
MRSPELKPQTLTIARTALVVLAVVFIIMGIANGGARDVLIKAVNICTECVGLG